MRGHHRHLTAAQRTRLSKALRGRHRHLTAAQRAHLSKALRGRHHAHRNARMKSITRRRVLRKAKKARLYHPPRTRKGRIRPARFVHGHRRLHARFRKGRNRHLGRFKAGRRHTQAWK